MKGRLTYGLAACLALCLASAGCRTETTTSVTPASDGTQTTTTTVTKTTPAIPAAPAPSSGAPAVSGTAATNSPTVPILSPLAGRWAGKSDMKDKGIDTLINSVKGGPLTGPSYLTLNADGTGYMQVGDKRDRPITWKLDEKNIIIKRSASDTGGTDEGLGDGPWVGTVSDNGKTLQVDMAKVRLTLYKK